MSRAEKSVQLMSPEHVERVRGPLRATLVACLAVSLAACGSTVPQADLATVASGTPSDGGLNASVDALAPSQTPPGSSLGADAGGSAVAGTPSVGPGVTQHGSGGSTSGRGGGPAGSGAAGGVPAGNSTPISVGIVTTKPAGEAAGTFGVQLDNGNERKMADAIVAAINRSGGLGGRPLEPVHFEIDPSRDANKSEDQLAAEICAAFTEDAKVEAVAYRAFSPQMAQCLGRKGVPLVSSVPTQIPNEEMLRRLPRFAGLGPSLDRYARTYALDLAEQAYFRGSTGTGLVVEERPEFQQVTESVLVPALRSRGVDVEVVYVPPASTANAPAIATASSNAILRWRGSRDRVMFLTTYSLVPLTFMQQAEQQGYRPRYGLGSGATPQLLKDSVSPNQLKSAVGVGIDPTFDSDPGAWRVDPPGRASCVALLEKAGMKFVKGSIADGAAVNSCDMLLLLKAGGDRLASAGHSVGTATLTAGITSLGGSFRAAGAHGTQFSSERRAAGTRFQRFAFVDECTCFRYTSDPLPIP
jgi:hypothetical protein